jgi:hypothetical protein
MTWEIDYTPPPTGAKFMKDDSRMRVLMGPVGCWPGDVEFLSPDGWVPLKDWDGQDVFGIDMPSGHGEFAQPVGYIDKPATKWVSFSGGDVKESITMSDDHVMPVLCDGSVVCMTALELADSVGDWAFFGYSENMGSHCTPKCAIIYGSKEGERKYCFTMPTGYFLVRVDGKLLISHNSGKSVTCCFEVVRRASMQAPGKDGKRRTRCAVVRETARQLQDTTMKTWLDWFPDGVCGRLMKTTKTYYLSVGDVECEVMFRALDDADDVANLNSLELTFAWFNECRDIHPDIVDAMSKRIGRFPSSKDGGPTWFGMWGDTNPPTMETWWYYQMEHLDPKDGVSPNENKWAVYKQPSGRSALAENIDNLPDGYYDTTGRSDEYIRVFIDGEYGLSSAGMPVYKYFRPDYHMAKERIRHIENGLRPVVIGVDAGLCYSDDTEVLTQDGWKLFKDVDELRDRVATLNPETFTMEYTDINFKVAKPYKGELVHFRTQNMDFMVTPEHRTPFTFRDTPGRLVFTSAEDLAGRTTSHRFIQVSGHDWAGVPYSFAGLSEKLSMQFMGWYLSEGCTSKYGNSYRCAITQATYPGIVDKMLSDPEWGRIGIKWHYAHAGKRVPVWRASGAVFKELYEIGHAKDKYIPRNLLNGTKEGLEVFLEAYVLGDGHVRTKVKKNSGIGRKCRNEVTITSTSIAIMDGLQEVCAKVGKCSSVVHRGPSQSRMRDGRIIRNTGIYSLTVKDIKRAEILPGSVSRVPYDGMVYCLNVPYHTLYVRRNGRPCWNGNTPAAVIGQMDARGRALILAECVSFDMGMQRFIRQLLKPLLAERFSGCPVLVVTDPAGMQRAQTDERSVVDIIRAEGFKVRPARTNTITARINAVDDYLMRQVDGDPAFLVDPSCVRLKAAMMGGYRYKPKGDNVIDKNDHSHVAEALQYLMLHISNSGEAALVTQRREIKRVSSLGWT